MSIPHPPMTPGGKPAIQVCQTQLQLNNGNHLRLGATQNLCLRSVRGVAWITVEMEAGETIVGPGDAFVISSGKTALVGPLHESVTLELGLAPNASARVASRPMLAKLRRLLRLEHSLGFGGV